MFELPFNKLVIIGVLAAFLIGPQRLPLYAAKLAQLIMGAKTNASGAKDRLTDQLGEDAQDVDWKQLDPRQYDPRRIVREALDPSEPSWSFRRRV
jgi:sec-independent protein translocase protein TatB